MQLDCIRILPTTVEGDFRDTVQRDFGERELFLIDDYATHQFPPDAPGISGEWPGERVSDGRPVWVAAVWIDTPDGDVEFGVTYRLDD